MIKQAQLDLLEAEQWSYLTLEEVTYSLGVNTQTINEIINEGIIPTQKNEHNELHFGHEALSRLRIVLQLNKDLGINWAGAALALELLNEIERLQAIIVGNS